jgi:hypothetical protein
MPGPTQMTYRGRIRNDMRSAFNHIHMLMNWDLWFKAKPMSYYPNQLAPLDQMNALFDGWETLQTMLATTGPIPSRNPPPAPLRVEPTPAYQDWIDAQKRARQPAQIVHG